MQLQKTLSPLWQDRCVRALLLSCMCGYDFLLVKNDPWIWGQRVTKSQATLLTPQTGPSGHRLCILALKPQYNTLLVLFLFSFLCSYIFGVQCYVNRWICFGFTFQLFVRTEYKYKWVSYKTKLTWLKNVL